MTRGRTGPILSMDPVRPATSSALATVRGAPRRSGCSLKRIVLALALLYALVCVAARYVSTWMLFPAPAPTYGEKLPGLVMIPGAQGGKYAAVFLPNPQARHLVLYFHGNGEDLGIDLPHLQDLRAAGFAVLAVDYPGYGLTGGTATEAGLYAAADAAFAHATGPLGWARERVVVYGLSLGGSAAVWVASRDRVGGLVLESTFTSAYRVITRWPVVLGERLPSLARIGRVRCPVLVMHGTADLVIPFSHGEALFAAAPEPKRTLWVENAGHCQVPVAAGDRYWRELRDFAASLP